MNDSVFNKIILGCSIFFSAGVWVNNFSLGFKIFLAVVASMTTMMAFFNQYKTFEKNFSTFYVVIVINRVFTYMKPKKNRQRGIRIIRKRKSE